ALPFGGSFTLGGGVRGGRGSFTPGGSLGRTGPTFSGTLILLSTVRWALLLARMCTGPLLTIVEWLFCLLWLSARLCEPFRPWLRALVWLRTRRWLSTRLCERSRVWLMRRLCEPRRPWLSRAEWEPSRLWLARDECEPMRKWL